MDFSAILAYKSLFFANRACNATKQAQDGKKCTAAANAARCTITASQGVVPLVAVSSCLAATAQSQTVKNAAEKVASSNLEKIAYAMTSNTTKSAISGMSKVVKVLSKLGIAGNISYAAAKCMDANEEEKNKVFMQAAGNCGGMYFFEHLYSKAVKEIAPDVASKAVESTAASVSNKLKLLKSVKPASVITGVGFVAASLFGCWAGEKVCGNIYDATAIEPALQPVPIGVSSSLTNSLNKIA